MATIYQVINVKESKGTFNGANFDNRNILCYTSDKSHYCISGSNTDTLKVKTDDFNYIIRVHGYQLDKLEGKLINPVFDKNGYVTDFELTTPDDNGEV